jgi:F-type H+-transporting ATPase subunit a
MAFASLSLDQLLTSPLWASVPLPAEVLFSGITNSVLVSAGLATALILFVRSAMKNAKLIPDGKQNLVEAAIEALYNQVEAIVGKKVAPKAFPLLGTIFIFVLCSNWFGLLPGVGTIGKIAPHHGGHEAAAHGSAAAAHGDVAPAGHGDAHATAVAAVAEATAASIEAVPSQQHIIPFLRPATSDYNFTLALAMISMAVWFYLTMKITGLKHFLAHIFTPDHGVKGAMGLFIGIIFIGVGVIEMISMASRPLSLSFRLFGNVYAGENLLHTMGDLGTTIGLPAWAAMMIKFLVPIPFYFMEVLVGILQALVFMLLSAVYIQLSTSDAHHDDEHGDDKAHSH